MQDQWCQSNKQVEYPLIEAYHLPADIKSKLCLHCVMYICMYVCVVNMYVYL